MQATERKFAAAGTLIVLLLLLANAGVSYWTTNQFVQDEGWVVHTREVLDSLDGVRAAVAEAETGQRGYLITGNTRYLKTYENAVANAQRELAKLRDRTIDNPEQQTRVDRLQALVGQRLERLQRNVSLRQETGFTAVQQVVGTDQGQELMDQIRQITDTMRETENELLAVRAENSKRSLQVKIGTNILGTLLGTIAVGLAFVLFRRRLDERKNAELTARAQAQRDAAIAELGQRAVSEASIESLTNKAVHKIAEVLDVPLVKLLELLSDGRAFLLRAGVGWHEGLVGHARISAGLDSQAGYTLHASQPLVKGDLTTHAPVIVDDLRTESRFSGPPLLLDHEVVSGISIIIYDQPDRPFGVLGAHTTEHRTFTEDDAHFLQAVANILAAAIQRRRAEEALRDNEKQFRALADSIPGIVWTSQPDGRCDYVNQQWYDYTGMTFAETEGFGWVSALKEDDVERSTNRWMHSVDTGEVFECEFRFRAQDGTYRWFLGRALPLWDEQGRVVKWFGNCIDVDEHKKMEDSLKDADRRKDEFLAMLAHELRNPLAPIRSGLDVLAGELGQDHEIVQIMQEQVEHVVRLVDDLLDVSRIVQGRINLRKKPVELSSVVYRAVSAVEAMLKSRGHELRISIPNEDIWLSADSVRLMQIIENLLNNAAKYTDDGGQIRLQAETADGHMCLRIRDNGVGIEPELMPRIFDLFTQSSRSLERSQGGLGIGLTLVRNLVEMHGGSISVASEGPGKGSEFTVRLPLIEPGAKTERPLAEPPASAVPRRVLVVDDNVAAAKMLALVLSDSGHHQIETVHNGPAALESLSSFHPHVMLLDIGLPGMDGYQVARTIRNDPAFDDLLLVALTGYGQQDDIQKSKAAGFDEHLVKPPSLDDLRRLLVHPKLKDVPAAEPVGDPAKARDSAGNPSERLPSKPLSTGVKRDIPTHLRTAVHELGNLAHAVRIAAYILNNKADSTRVSEVREMLEETAESMGELVQWLRETSVSFGSRPPHAAGRS